MAQETLQSLREKSAAFFAEKGVDEPRLSAELLLAHAAHCRRMDLFLRFDQPVNDEELAHFREMVRRRLAGEPVQYITGATEFYGLPIRVNPAVLIPRPETELLVERALHTAEERFADRDLRILDIGTGSGCIALALAQRLPRATVMAVEAEPAAAEVARENTAELDLAERVRVALCDVLTDLPADGPYDLVVSNPPYIPLAEMDALQSEVRGHEPHRALSDGADGLTFHRRIATLARDLLAPGGALLVEIGFDQSDAVQAILAAAGLSVLSVTDDYAGIPRVVEAAFDVPASPPASD